MKKNFVKKLASVLSLALVVTTLAPAASASAAAAPNLAKRYTNVYEGNSYSYAVKNAAGLSVKWVVSGEGAEYAKLSNITGSKTTLTVDTNKEVAAKNDAVVVSAKLYKAGKLVKTTGDVVTLKVSATNVDITTAADVTSVAAGEVVDFNRSITPVNATSATYWSVTDKNGAATTKATIDASGKFTATTEGEYVVVAEAKNAKTGAVVAKDTQAVKVSFSVAEVKAVNSKTVTIKFTKPVLSSTVVDGTNTLTSAVTFTKIGAPQDITSSSAGAVLSADGKTLTVTAQTTEFFAGSYAVTIDNTVMDSTNAIAVEAYSKVLNLTDSVRPTATVSYPSNGVARVTFSEPMDVANAAAIEAAMSIASPAGEAAVSAGGKVTLAADKASFDIALASLVLDKDYTVTLVGVADFAGNLITPNPNVFTIRKANTDSVKPTVVSMEALDVDTIKVTFSERLGALGTINGEAIVVGTNATVDSTGLVYTITTQTVPANLVGVTVVTLAGFADVSANAGLNVVRTLNFVADTTLPVYVSHEVKTEGADQFLYIKYSENVVLGAPVNALTGTYVDNNSITKGMTPIVVADASLSLVGTATTSDTIKIKISGLTAGTYTVATDAALVDDAAGNSAAAKTVTFAFGTYADPTVPTASITSVQTSADTVVVAFSMDVTAATALNVANYTVEGQQIFQSAIFDNNARTVKLTLAPNAITVSGNRLLTVKNVATAAGKVMADFTSTQLFKENVKPYLVSASIASATSITATFSENVTGSINGFEVYVDGVKIAAGVTATAPAANIVTITIPEITDLTKTYTVKFIGTDFADTTLPANAAVLNTIVTVAK